MGNSKHTLLLSRESNNPPANGLEYVLLFRLSKHRFLMPKLPKRRTGMKGWEDLRKWLYLHECLQACPRFNLPAVHPAIWLACRLTCLPASRHTGKPANRPRSANRRLKYNMERHGIKRDSAFGFQPQDEQQMYSSDKIVALLIIPTFLCLQNYLV